jgi:elongation factor P
MNRMTVSTTDIRPGNKVEVDRAPWVVINNEFVKPGKGQAFNRIKMKNLMTGQQVERTYKSGEKIELADVEEKTMTYLYDEGDGAVFMDGKSFEQVSVNADIIQPMKHWLMEEVPYQITFYKGNVIEIVPPCFLEMTVVETTPAVRGDTSGRVLKAAKTNTGATIQVPIFIEEGQRIKVDTRTHEYASRASDK